MKIKVLSIVLALAMLFTLAACGGSDAGSDISPAPEASQTPDPVETDTPDVDTPETDAPAQEPDAQPDEQPDVEVEQPEADTPAVMPDAPAAMPEQPADAPETEQPAAGEVTAEQGALSLLESIWALYPAGDRFAAAGGDYSEEHSVSDAPGIYSIADAQQLDSVFGVPADKSGAIDGAASLMHMMNANTFTCGAFHLKGGEDAAAFALALKDNILQRHWMCGFPDKVIIYSVGEYIVSAFGNADIMDMFFAKLVEADSTATLLYEEPIV